MTGILLGVAVLAGAFFGVAGIAVVAVACLAGLQLGWLRFVWATCFVIAAAAGFLRAADATRISTPPDWVSTRHSFQGEIESSSTSDGRFQRFIAQASPAGAGEPVRACIIGPAAPLVGRGDRVAFTGDVKTLAEVAVPTRDFLVREGCAVSISTRDLVLLDRGTGLLATLDRFRQRATHRLQRLVPGDAGALASGLVTGDDAALSPETRDAFYLTGTSHVTAVSGSNLALFVGFFATAGAAAGWMRRLAWQLSTIAVVWTYVLMIGASPPAFRAGLVATLSIFAIRVGRKPDLLTLAALVAAAQVLIRPQDAGSLSYRLSTAAALGLLLALGADRPPSAWDWARRAAVATCAANLATAPVLLATVGLPFPFRSLIANVAIAPLIDLLFPLSMVAALAGAVWFPAAEWIAPLVELLSRLTLAIVRLCARIPGPPLRTETVLIDRWVWFALIVALFCLASREVRGGLVRLARRWRAVERARSFGAVAVLVSAGAGLLIAWAGR